MPITLLRWKSGSAGDTILRMLLDSNSISSQTRYLGTGIKTEIDIPYVRAFRYPAVAEMSLQNAAQVDIEDLRRELQQLYTDDPDKQWLLKTHCYGDFDWPVIDITIDRCLVPFVVKAGLSKNQRQHGMISDYHPLIKKIRDPAILHYFDCYNFAQDIIRMPAPSARQIPLSAILSGWSDLVSAVESIGYELSLQCRPYYELWLDSNQQYMPSERWTSMCRNQNYDFTDMTISLEEKYCLLALSNQRFRDLSNV